MLDLGVQDDKKLLPIILLIMISFGFSIEDTLADNDLPLCDNEYTNSIDPIDLSTVPPPSEEELDDPAVCRIPMEVQSFKPGELSLSDLPSLRVTDISELQGYAPNVAYAWAQNLFSCEIPSPSCSVNSPGFYEVRTNFTTQQPTLTPGENWWNYHYTNRYHISHPSYTQTCAGFSDAETISAGVAKGQVGNYLLDNEAIVENYIRDEYGNLVCIVNRSYLNFQPPGALYFRTYRTAYDTWSTDIWLGYWFNINDVWTEWDVAADFQSGQEIATYGGDLNNIQAAFISFSHRLEVAGTSNSLRPWSNRSLVYPLKNHSVFYIDPIFHGLDVVGGDFTAMATYIFP